MAEKIDWPPIGMTLEEAAASLRVNPRTLHELIRRGEFPARKVGVGWRIDPGRRQGMAGKRTRQRTGRREITHKTARHGGRLSSCRA